MPSKTEPDGRAAIGLPRTATNRQAVTYLKLIREVRRDPAWGGWEIRGDLLQPGGRIPLEEIPEPGLLLECAGAEGAGWGHRRRPYVYLLWRLDRQAGQWRELARTATVNRDWTLDLGPIAKRELEPPGPVLIDPEGAASRVMIALDRELEKLDLQAQRLVLLALYDRVAARAAG